MGDGKDMSIYYSDRLGSTSKVEVQNIRRKTNQYVTKAKWEKAASLPIWRRLIYMLCGFTMNSPEFQDKDSYGYQTGRKSAKVLAKEAVQSLHEPDHLQR